uniref:Astacin domain-containing protein n=1 Tax=Parastrongyloides trichosuri TaxID=131310 RepID=A0A0N4ZGS3_PARTI
MYCSRSSILNFLLIISIFIYTANSKQIRKNSVSKKPPNFSDLNKITVGFSSFKTTQGLKLRAALGQISAKTCIKFEERNKDVKSDKGFTFKSSSECYAPNG